MTPDGQTYDVGLASLGPTALPLCSTGSLERQSGAQGCLGILWNSWGDLWFQDLVQRLQVEILCILAVLARLDLC